MRRAAAASAANSPIGQIAIGLVVGLSAVGLFVAVWLLTRVQLS